MIDGIKRQVEAALQTRKLVAGVIGDPVSHSLSPRLHGFWLKKYGIDGGYIAIHVKSGQLAEFLDWLPQSGLRGVNVTIPHKEETARRVTNHLDAAPAVIGAQNTLVVERGQLVGGNTDYIGFRDNLLAGAPDLRALGKTALVLGAGGSARAVVFALAQMGCARVHLHNRTAQRAADLAVDISKSMTKFGFLVPEIRPAGLGELNDDLGCAEAAIIANTTAAELNGAGSLDFPFDRLQSTAVVTDIVYKPLETPFLAAARARGLKTVDGLGMLLYQAAPGFEAWFGVKPDVTPDLRAYMEQSL